MTRESKKKILFISHSSLLYGAQRSFFDIINNIDKDRYCPIVVVPKNGPLTDKLEAVGVSVIKRAISHWTPSPDDRNFAYVLNFVRGFRARVWAIASLIEELHVDVVYTNTVTVVEGAVAAKLTKRPHVWHLRENINGNKELTKLLPGFLMKIIIGHLSDVIMCNSRYLKGRLVFPRYDEKACVIYNGISSPYVRGSTNVAERRHGLGIGRDDKVVIIVGALHERKGHELFLKAGKIVVQYFSDTKLLVVGEGDEKYKRRLVSLCKTIGLEENTFFLGYQKKASELIAMSDVLVVASNQEPFGKVVIEAMAQRTPVVSTLCGGPEEIIEHGVSGLLVRNGDPDELAAGLVKILGDPDWAKRMASAGYQRVEELFSLKQNISHIESCLESVTC